ncbi:hypothetical protein AB0M23_28490 [Streptomyces sp. NPDC052077]|uniref:hypothetical protein n=1 Tax=Streptomyces sp. NPDC052077 TaxID=3154757 RepID=UPI003430191D
MPSSDEILQQIDAAVHDWTVSGDAMRCRPAPEPPPELPPAPAVPYTGHAAARSHLVGRLISQGLTPSEAAAAVRTAETGEPAEHLELALAEAHAAAAEARQHILRAAATLLRALQPAVQAAAAALRQLADATRTTGPDGTGGGPGRRRDRPAWQSPYGPAPRRKR